MRPTHSQPAEELSIWATSNRAARFASDTAIILPMSFSDHSDILATHYSRFGSISTSTSSSRASVRTPINFSPQPFDTPQMNPLTPNPDEECQGEL